MDSGAQQSLEEEELQALLTGSIESGRCAVDGCQFTDIDARGPVTIKGVKHKMCIRHWEANIGVLAGYRMDLF